MRLAIVIGVLALLTTVGVGLYVTDFTAYLGNNPETCNNCHVMDAVYENWYHGAHHEWTTCNDCHTPHSLIPKYYVKALSGYHHVTTFFFKDIPSAIRAKESSKKVVQENCIRCHEEAVANIEMNQNMDGNSGPQRYCFSCHRSVTHGQRGLAVYPYEHPEERK